MASALIIYFTLRNSFTYLAKSHPDSRQLDGAYRSALMDMGAGLDELYLAGSASARGILRQAAEEKLQGDKKLALLMIKGIPCSIYWMLCSDIAYGQYDSRCGIRRSFRY